MHSNIRLVISFAVARIVCLATALFVLPAAAGTNSWTAIGPVAYPFAVDPSSPSTIYAVVNGNTVTKTTDGGEHWADLTVFAFDSVNSLVIDHQSPATIYAALGDFWDLEAVPIYRSVDGGAHWAAEAADFNYLPALVVAIAPSLSSTLYAGATDAVFKSIDGGLSWALRENGLAGFVVSALAIDPTNADVVYVAQQVATVPATGKIFKSTDGGEQWRQVPIPVPAGAAIWSLAIDPATPSIVYAAYASGNVGKGGVLKSIDGGETWIAAQNGLPDTISVNALAIDPSTPARIYAATDQGVFRSTDAAASWTPINSGLTNLHVWSLSIDRTGSLLRAATAAGLFTVTVGTGGTCGTNAATNAALVEQYYVAILRRPSEAGGKAFWTSEADRLCGLGADPKQTFGVMANVFFNTPEYLAFNRDDNGFVTDLYNAFFNRLPDAAGLSYWLGQLASGMPRNNVMSSFLLSPEFTATMNIAFPGQTARAETYLVLNLYGGLFRRLAESSGYSYWTGQIRIAQCSASPAAAVHGTIDSVSGQFVASAEYAGRASTNSQYIVDLYYALLQRGAELAGFNYWVGQLNASLLTREQVRQQFLTSPEMTAQSAAIAAQGCPH